MQGSGNRYGPVRRDLLAGFTLIELLVAIAIIGLLLALILPAVHQARAAARRTQCRNNLRQIAIAFQNHEALHGRLPSNGWGFQWIGEPGRGSNEQQPGGWVYNLLGFVEQDALAKSGRGLSEPERSAALGNLTQTPVAVFRCPSRPARPLELHNPLIPPFNAEWRPVVAKTDYAVNEGDYITDTRSGPTTLEAGDSGTYPWVDTSRATGVCFQRSRIRMQDIRDGTSNTYLVGEKYVSSLQYNSEQDPGYDQSMYCGVDLDINRWTILPPQSDGASVGIDASRQFGSAHPGVCHFVMCDGSVRAVSYAVDAEVHRAAGNRRDGN